MKKYLMGLEQTKRFETFPAKLSKDKGYGLGMVYEVEKSKIQRIKEFLQKECPPESLYKAQCVVRGQNR